MSIYKKIAEARVKLQESKLTKSGFNKFANFKYYELADFLPSLNRINLELGICTKFEIDQEGKKAVLKIFDFDKPEEIVTFDIPYVSCEVKGANEIQNLGSTITYLRRYLFLVAFEITDGDVVDAQKPQEQEKQQNNAKNEAAKMVSQEQLSKIYTVANKMGINKTDLEPAIFKEYAVKSMKNLTMAQASEIISRVEDIIAVVIERKKNCIKVIAELELDDELMAIMEEKKIESLEKASLETCKEVYRQLKKIKEDKAKGGTAA